MARQRQEDTRPGLVGGILPPADCRFHLRADPEVDPGLLLAVCGRTPEIMTFSAAGERIPVRTLMEAQEWDKPEPLFVVTSRDLHAPGCASVFGWADPRLRVAVVSMHRLKSPDRLRTSQRVAKVIAHERHHLEGRRHCRTPGCVLHPVSSVEQLDLRGMELCARCRRPGRSWLAGAAVLGLCLLFSWGVDAALTALSRKAVPFSWRAEEGGAAVTYKGASVLRLRSLDEAAAAAKGLNSLFANLDPPPLEVHQDGVAVRVEAGGKPLFEVDPGLTGATPPALFARGWVARLEPLIQGKGTAAEGCPDCHTFRRGEVREAALKRAKWWR